MSAETSAEMSATGPAEERADGTGGGSNTTVPVRFRSRR